MSWTKERDFAEDGFELAERVGFLPTHSDKSNDNEK
jgi:hypothetical protein